MKSFKPFQVLFFLIPFIFPISAFSQSIDEAVGALAEELGAQLGEEGTERLAIFSFSDLNGFESALGDFISEELTTSLFGVGDFQIVERTELNRVIQEHELYASGIFDTDTIAELGKFLAIDALVTGTITRFDESVRINSKVIDISTGRIFAAAAVTLPRDSMVDSLLKQSSGGLVGKSRRVDGVINQTSEVFFENGFLRIEPTAVILSEDKKSFTVTTEFQNITNEPLLINQVLSHQETLATTKHGDEFKELQVSTVRVANSIGANNPDRYTRIEPGSSVTAVWKDTTRNRRSIVGDRLVLRLMLRRYVNGSGNEFAAQLDNIVLE
tara:strand:+ start:9046 stop:10026 length:981 start_codon:yes stop_codon:yes gene_type:complete